MTIYDIRRKNLRSLLDDLFGGKQVELANALERSPSYISRILSVHSDEPSPSTRNIGETLARDIEAQLGLPRYSLDDASDQLSSHIKEPRRAYQTHLYERVPEAQRRAIENIAALLLKLDADQTQAVERALKLLLRLRSG